MTDDLSELRGRLRAVRNTSGWIGRHPWITATGATGVGLLLAGALRRRPREAVSSAPGTLRRSLITALVSVASRVILGTVEKRLKQALSNKFSDRP